MAADYYLAPSLSTLRNEINKAHPKRDTTSDGWIGDASHQARVSDHNPDWSSDGVVRALDVDVDGINVYELIEIFKKDSRVEYFIYNHYIYLRSTGFKRQRYTGTNPHVGHIHVSLRHTAAAENARPWGYDGAPDKAVAPAPAPAGKKSNAAVAKEVIAGDWGNNPERSRKLLQAGYSPAAVQAEVNKLLNTKGNTPTRLSVSALAAQVIAGQWGNGQERYSRLSQAGYDSTAVQAEVNRRYAKR